MVRLSETSKLGCKSWSLQAVETCPGSVAPGGGLVEACRGCYATTGNYRFPNVKAPRQHNREDWKRDGWVSDMVEALAGETHFRWFDSGDMFSLALATKIAEVCALTPKVKHWIPTRMAKFPKFQPIIAALNALPNVVVRASLDDVFTGQFSTAGYVGPLSGIIADPTVPTDAKICAAYQNNGKCGSCRACWSKDVKAIAYPAHGVKMAKVISIKVAA